MTDIRLPWDHVQPPTQSYYLAVLESLLVPGNNIELTYDEVEDTVTIDAAGGGSGGLFRGSWQASPEDLIYSETFPVDAGAWTGGGRVAMSSAIGTSKPSFPGALSMQGFSGSDTAMVLSLAAIPATVGRSLTRATVWHAQSKQSGSQAGTFQLATNSGATIAWQTVLGGSAAATSAWTQDTIPNPVTDLRARLIAPGGSGNNVRTFAISGIDLYAAVPGWTGYQTGEYVIHQGRLFVSLGDSNLTEPGTPGGASSWNEVPLYATPKAPNAQAAAYQLALSDIDRTVILTNAAAVALTIPTNATVAFPIGARLEFVQGGAGVVTATPASGVTLNGLGATTAQWDRRVLIKTANDTWLCAA